MTGGPVYLPSVTAWRGEEGRKASADELTHRGIGRSTMLSSVTRAFRCDRRVHDVGDMGRMVAT
ncbi:MAG: hypothetical protein RIE24_03215 [Silicimonas sp.]